MSGDRGVHDTGASGPGQIHRAIQRDSNVLEHHSVKTSPIVLSAAKHPPTNVVNVFGEIAGSGVNTFPW